MNTAFTPRTCPICNIINHISKAHEANIAAESYRRDGNSALVGLFESTAQNARIAAASTYAMKIGSKS